MIRAYSVPTVRALEAVAMAAAPEGELMQRAAEGLASVALARLEEFGGRRVVALVGTGDNGGDTSYAAAHLSEAGYPCVVVVAPETGREHVHAVALEAARAAGAAVLVAVEDLPGALAAVAEADLVLDGIVGIGGRPGLRPTAAQLVDAIADDAWLVAVDLASGLDPEGRESSDDSVWADETVTFGVPKPVHLLPAGEGASGRLTVVDIGLDPQAAPVAVERILRDDVHSRWPIPGPGDDKYSRGVLGLVAGGETYSGAAVLAATAAVETGVGMVRYIGTPTPTGLVRLAVPEAVIGAGTVQAWVIGPGLDVTETSSEASAQRDVARAALDSDLPVLLDAGGLDLLTAEVVEARRGRPTLLTPHAGELARTLSRLGEGRGVTRAEVEADPVAAATSLVEATGATVLLKGSTTLVVGPDGPVGSQTDAPAWLATAGAGDVLAGVIGTLLAAGLAPHDAATLGALVHGVAADRVSGGGPIRARDVAAALGPTVRDLLRRGSVLEGPPNGEAP